MLQAVVCSSMAPSRLSLLHHDFTFSTSTIPGLGEVGHRTHTATAMFGLKSPSLLGNTLVSLEGQSWGRGGPSPWN